MNPSFKLTELEGTAETATLVIEPLEPGYGHTLGNALRRVLLSSLPGVAVSMVRIDGVEHQFATLEGMSQDIVELILNIKLIRVKSSGPTTGTLKLDVKGEREVTAADVECESGFEIVNPTQYIATLAKGKSLKLEMTVETGTGYSMAKDRRSDVIGEIPVDALFSPVVKVSYHVEDTRVGRRTDYNKLVLQVMTDGTISPVEAVQQASRILARQFTQVFNPTQEADAVQASSVSPEEAEVFKLTVEELDLPTRIANALRKGGFKTVGDLVGTPRDIIAKVKNLGEKSVDVIDAALSKKGVSTEEGVLSK